MIINHDCTAEEYQRLLTAGVPTDAFLPTGKKMNLNLRVQDIEYTNKFATKCVTADAQIEALRDFMSDYSKPDILIISSYPNDYAAKCVGLHAFIEGAKFFFSKDKRKLELSKRGINTSPRWHSVYATFDDAVIKNYSQIPSMYVFSEVVDNSTPRKIELLRELLVRTSRTKRVVVTSSADPLEFADMLRIRANSHVWLCPKG